MKTRKNKKINNKINKRKTKGGVGLYSDPTKSCADIKKDWKTGWKHKPGYEKYKPYMFYPGKYNLMSKLPYQLEQQKNGRVICYEPTNKECAENKRDWELFWSKNPRYAVYNPGTLYEGNDYVTPSVHSLTDDKGKAKTCHTGAPGEPPLTQSDFRRGIKPIHLDTIPSTEKRIGYKVLDMSSESQLVNYSIQIANTYKTTKTTKCDQLSVKDTKANQFHFFRMFKNNNVVVDSDLYEKAFDAAIKLLKDNGFASDTSYGGNKINVVHTNATNTTVSSGFMVDCDNDGYQGKNVTSIVVYVDAKCVGGDIEIYNDIAMFNDPVAPQEVISPKADNPDKDRRVIILDGEKMHYPTDVIQGTKLAVVYNIKQ
jgi:hypothetical protein